MGSLSARHRARIAVEVACTYPGMLYALRRYPPAVMARAARSVGAPALTTPPVAALDEAARLGSMVGQLLRLLPTDSRCLIQSLVLSRVLARRAIEARIVIGVQVDAGFKAHAWVEHQGSPVLPRLHYEPLVEL